MSLSSSSNNSSGIPHYRQCNHDECCICRDNMTQIRKIYKCPRCTFTSHINCIVRWFNSSKSEICPACSYDYTQFISPSQRNLPFPFILDGLSFTEFHKKIERMYVNSELSRYIDYLLEFNNGARFHQYLRWTNTFYYSALDNLTNKFSNYIARFNPQRSMDTIYTYGNGVVHKIFCERQYSYQQKYKTQEIWLKNGKLHRSHDQPAVISYRPNGMIYRQSWYKRDKYYRMNVNDPTNILYDNRGHIQIKEWKNAQGSFDYGRPGRIIYYINDDNATEEQYFNESSNLIKIKHLNKLGQLNVSANGPALILYENGKCIYKYYEDGIFIGQYEADNHETTSTEILSHSYIKSLGQQTNNNNDVIISNTLILKKRKRENDD